MSRSSKKENKKVIFRRIGGRIVPFAVAAGGAGIAADALRTKRVYEKGDVTIDLKKNVREKFSMFGRADQTEIRVKGKKAGYANFKRIDGDDFRFNFLSISKKFREKGLSKILSKQTAVEMKKQGGKTITNQVIHKGSLLSNFGKNDTLYKLEAGNKYLDKKIGRRTAYSMLHDLMEKKKNKKGFMKYLIDPAKESDVFRETSLKGLRTKGKGFIKPFRTKKNKATIAIGAAAFIGGTAYGVFRNEK